MLGLSCCPRAFSSCGEQRLLFVAVCVPLIAVAFPLAEHGLQVRGPQQLWHEGSVVVAHGLQSTGSVVVAHGAQLLHGMWDPPGTRDRTCVPCIGRRIPNHCSTREVPKIDLNLCFTPSAL